MWSTLGVAVVACLLVVCSCQLIQESWNIPICRSDSDQCVKGMGGSIALTPSMPNYSFKRFKYPSPNDSRSLITLQKPITVSLQMLPPVANLPLVLNLRGFRPYELYQYDELCSIIEDGPCYDSSDMAPPTSDRSERFVLCCLDARSPRGKGQHCLRYNYSSEIFIYEIKKPTFYYRVAVNISNGNESHSFTLNSVTTTAAIANFSTFELLVYEQSSFSLLSFEFLRANLWAVESSPTQSGRVASPSDWFQIPMQRIGDGLQIGITASEWREAASCALPIPTDPVEPYRSYSLDSFVSIKSLSVSGPTDLKLTMSAEFEEVPNMRVDFLIENVY